MPQRVVPSSRVPNGEGPGLRGFSLVEVTLALGVAAVALVAIFGLLPMGLLSSRDVVQVTMATQIAGAIDCDLRTSAAMGTSTSGSSAIYGIPLLSPTNILQTGTSEFYLDNLGNKTGTAASAKFRARIVVVAPAAAGTFTTNSTIAPVSYASILLTWPAAAPTSSNPSRLEVASSFSWPH